MQALSPGQSELITHSGWQPVILEGIPWRPGKHLQTAVSPIFSQMVLGPHGDGEQGSLSFGPNINIFIIVKMKSENFFLFFDKNSSNCIMIMIVIYNL